MARLTTAHLMTGERMPGESAFPSPSEALVDLVAYRRNLTRMRRAIAPAELMAVVKADAYGHGLLPVAHTAVAHGVKWLGTIDVASALKLRADGIGSRVRIFSWLFGADEDYRSAIEADIDLGVSTLAQLRGIAGSGASRAARLHLKIDTGLHRYGASPADWPALVSEALALEEPGIAEVYAAWTHIAEAGEDEDSAAIARFHDAVALAEGLGARFSLRHLAASAAGLARADARFDMVRVGAFGYGISPGDGVRPEQIGVSPVMTLSAIIPTTVRRDGRELAVVPIGSADGIPPAAAGKSLVAIRGVRRRIVGSIELDHFLVDVDGAAVSAGDRAWLFGPGSHAEPTLQEWGDVLGTIGEEIAVRVGPRIPRRYLGR